MQSTMYALVDCNNFYVSCERVFNPKLHNRPVIVLSNNDGCAVSRSNEAKKLGIAMGVPLFQVQSIVRKHNVAVLSSNFALYGEMSARVMQVIHNSVPEAEVYSVDEAFLDLSSMQYSYDLLGFCQQLALKIEQYTGIPVSIGIAPTRTLAKVANQIAKNQNITGRVLALDSSTKLQQALSTFKVRDIWGIGLQSEKKLQAIGVNTASELINLSELTIKRSFNILMWRKVQELKGISCIELPDSRASKQQIMVSRSFGERVTALEHLQQALATYVSAGCEKLRKQKSVCAGLYVFLRTGLHGAEHTIYKNSVYMHLPNPCNDTRTILQAGKDILRQLFKTGYRYQKVGVILCDLSAADSMQIDIFGDNNLVQSENLMQTIDQINRKLGRQSVQFAASGLDKTWKVKNEHKSGNYTGDWQELPIVKLF